MLLDIKGSALGPGKREVSLSSIPLLLGIEGKKSARKGQGALSVSFVVDEVCVQRWQSHKAKSCQAPMKGTETPRAAQSICSDFQLNLDENGAENSMRKEGWGGVQIENLESFMQSANLGNLKFVKIFMYLELL
jgi:hypothetical protein